MLLSLSLETLCKWNCSTTNIWWAAWAWVRNIFRPFSHALSVSLFCSSPVSLSIEKRADYVIWIFYVEMHFALAAWSHSCNICKEICVKYSKSYWFIHAIFESHAAQFQMPWRKDDMIQMARNFRTNIWNAKTFALFNGFGKFYRKINKENWKCS